MGVNDFSYLMNAHEKQLKLKCSAFDLFTLDSKDKPVFKHKSLIFKIIKFDLLTWKIIFCRTFLFRSQIYIVVVTEICGVLIHQVARTFLAARLFVAPLFCKHSVQSINCIHNQLLIVEVVLYLQLYKSIKS